MNIPTILIIAGIAIVIVALLARRGGGPRVTTIERTRVTRDEGDSDA